jgi:hypothetical protein
MALPCQPFAWTGIFGFCSAFVSVSAERIYGAGLGRNGVGSDVNEYYERHILEQAILWWLSMLCIYGASSLSVFWISFSRKGKKIEIRSYPTWLQS